MIHFPALSDTYIFGKVSKCIRLLAQLGLSIFLMLSAGLAAADHAVAIHIEESERHQIGAELRFWHEKPSVATIDQAAASNAATRFVAIKDELMFDLKPQDSLWIKLDVERKQASPDRFILWIPLPLLDVVTLYQSEVSKGAKGDDKTQWKSQRAGDRVAVSSWPEPGRYPKFHVELPIGQTTIYLQIKGSTPISLPIYLGTEIRAQAFDRQGFLGMGLIFGVLLTLVLMCFVTAYTYKDRLYLWYGIYMLVMILAVGAYTGLSAYLLWDQSPVWADASQGALAFLSAGGALYFIEAMLGGRKFAKRLSGFLLGLSVSAIPLAILYCFLPRAYGVIILGVYMLTITFIGLSLAVRAWRRGDAVGQWVFIAYAPLALAVLSALARSYGWISVSWIVQYGVIVALLIEAPMMMVALNVRSRDRHEIRTREQAMKTQDALTGLLNEHIFDDRLRQTLDRSIKRREDAAVVLISLVNYQAIAQAHGPSIAEQSVLRAVIKLRKVIHGVETVARIGTSQFGLIFDGVKHRGPITEAGARLIAQGLMPLPGLVPEVTLQFHIAAALLRDMPTQQSDIKSDLLGILAAMSRRTRRPIRFWQPTTVGGTLIPPMTPVSVTPAIVAHKGGDTEPMNIGASSNEDSGWPLKPWDSKLTSDSSGFGGDSVMRPKGKP